MYIPSWYIYSKNHFYNTCIFNTTIICNKLINIHKKVHPPLIADPIVLQKKFIKNKVVKMGVALNFYKRLYNPRHLPVGMADGEGCEWLWAYLHPFGRTNRIDILTNAIIHSTTKTKII